jgi:hypothetical protein
MTRILSDLCKSEYEDFVAELRKNWSVPQTTVKQLHSQIKQIHRSYLSLACAATVTAHRASRNEYLTGLVEANYLSMVLAIKGVENPCCVLLRQSIELLLKHIYFSTHPVEYTWAKSRESYRDLTYQFLLEYLRRTDEISKITNPKSVVDRLDYHYAILSRYVHVHSQSFIGYKILSTSENRPYIVVGRMRQRTTELWPLLTLTLIASLPRRFLSASASERDLVRKGLPRKHRELLDGLLKAIALAGSGK